MNTALTFLLVVVAVGHCFNRDECEEDDYSYEYDQRKAFRSQVQDNLRPDPESVVPNNYRTVNTNKGPVRGYHVQFEPHEKNPISGEGDVFMGIPYAQPPLGERRFQPAVPPEPWTTLHDSTHYRKFCAQMQEFGQFNKDTAEDCLYMNVYTPNAQSPAGTYPVLVYFHNGWNFLGPHAFLTEHITHNFLRKGVIIVTIQARHDLFAQFTTHTADFPANNQLSDTTTALQWIQDEIGHFGGDKDKVTLGGSNYGGCQAALHMYSPRARGLFHQTLEVGFTISHHRGLCNHVPAGRKIFCDGKEGPASKNLAIQLCELTEDQWNNIGTDQEAVQKLRTCLQTHSTERMLNASLVAQGGFIQAPTSFKPIVDGEGGYLPKPFKELELEQPHLPVMLGRYVMEYPTPLQRTSRYGQRSFRRETEFLLNQMNPPNSTKDEIRQLLLNFNRNLLPRNDPYYWHKVHKWTRDQDHLTQFQTRTRNLIEKVGNERVYLFRFDHLTEYAKLDQNLPRQHQHTAHFHENIYMFGADPRFHGDADSLGSDEECPGCFNVTCFNNDEDWHFIEQMSDLYVNYVKTGVPHPNWNPVTRQAPLQFYKIDTTSRMEPHLEPRGDELWNRLIPELLQGRRPRYNVMKH